MSVKLTDAERTYYVKGCMLKNKGNDGIYLCADYKNKKGEKHCFCEFDNCPQCDKAETLITAHVEQAVSAYKRELLEMLPKDKSSYECPNSGKSDCGTDMYNSLLAEVRKLIEEGV